MVKLGTRSELIRPREREQICSARVSPGIRPSLFTQHPCQPTATFNFGRDISKDETIIIANKAEESRMGDRQTVTQANLVC